MKKVNFESEAKELDEFYWSDWKDRHALLQNIDDALSAYGFELVVADTGDDMDFIKIEKKNPPVKTIKALITVEGGIVQDVTATAPICVDIVDYDKGADDPVIFKQDSVDQVVSEQTYQGYIDAIEQELQSNEGEVSND